MKTDILEYGEPNSPFDFRGFGVLLSTPFRFLPVRRMAAASNDFSMLSLLKDPVGKFASLIAFHTNLNRSI